MNSKALQLPQRNEGRYRKNQNEDTLGKKTNPDFRSAVPLLCCLVSHGKATLSPCFLLFPICRVHSAQEPPHDSVKEKFPVKDTVSLLESQEHSLKATGFIVPDVPFKVQQLLKMSLLEGKEVVSKVERRDKSNGPIFLLS